MLCAGQARVDRKAVARLLDGQWRKVTLHAERRISCTFSGVVTSVTDVLRELEDTAEKNSISAM